MSKQGSTKIRGLRDIYGYHDRFDVVLACAFELEEKGNEKFGFYDKMGGVTQSIGKKPYLPHKEIDLNWPPEKIYDITNKIVIPCSDIVIGYLGLQSLATGIMIGSAFKHKIPVSYFYEKKVGLDSLKYKKTNLELGINEYSVELISGDTKNVDPSCEIVDPECRGEIYDLIEFEDENEALEKLKLSLEAFYNKITG